MKLKNITMKTGVLIKLINNNLYFNFFNFNIVSF